MKLPLTLPLDNSADRKIGLIRTHDGRVLLQIEITAPEEETALAHWMLAITAPVRA